MDVYTYRREIWWVNWLFPGMGSTVEKEGAFPSEFSLHPTQTFASPGRSWTSPQGATHYSLLDVPFWNRWWQMHPVLVLLVFQIHHPDTHLLSSYELQVSPSIQRGGIGKTLVGCLYNIARQWEMRKIVLTALKGENAAVSLGLAHTQSLFGREPSCILILQGCGVGTISHLYVRRANCLHEASSRTKKGWIMVIHSISHGPIR